MQRKLAVIALGFPNSGKSTTWYKLFGRVIRTGWKKLFVDNKLRSVYFRNGSYEERGDEIEDDVFFRNASFEEYGDEAEEYFEKETNQPEVIFCAVQYIEKGNRTINWFVENGYELYIQWLNPGFHGEPYEDYLRFEEKFSPFGTFTKVSGKETTERVRTIREFLFQWYTIT